MNKKKLFLWCLYDFANSVAFINFLLYFSQWLVIDGGVHDFWYNATFAFVTLFLLISAPILASYTDKYGGRKYFINLATVGTFIGYGTTATLAYFTPHLIAPIILLFIFGQYCYQLSFVFYNPLIEEVASSEFRSRASGLGQFSNFLGQVVGLVITLPITSSRILPLFPALLIFVLLALPLMLFFREEKFSILEFEKMKKESRGSLKKLFSFFSVSLATPMLVAFFFFNDALVTVSNNYAIYLEKVFHTPDSTKSLLLMGILIMSAIGSIVGGWLGDKMGNLKALKIILWGWVTFLPLTALAPNITVLTPLTFILGLLMGAVWTVTRSYLSILLSKEDMGYGFSFYTLAERFATFIGPLTWGGMLLFLGTEASSYRITMLTMVFFIVIGLLILSRKKAALLVQL